MRHIHLVGDFIPNKELDNFRDKFGQLCVLDMRVLKNERELLQEFQIESWLDLMNLHCTIVVKEFERLVKMNKSIVEALVYVSTNSESTLITCSRYSWFVFTFYSPFMEEHQINLISSEPHLKDDKCFGILKSILNRLVGNDRGIRLAFEHLKGSFDYTTPDAMIAFKKFQSSATYYLSSLGVFPGTFYSHFPSSISNFDLRRKIYDVCSVDRLC